MTEGTKIGHKKRRQFDAFPFWVQKPKITENDNLPQEFRMFTKKKYLKYLEKRAKK